MLVAINIAFVPRYGYMACAWAGFAGYGTAMLLSYFVGRKYYPVAYPLKRIAGYVLLAAAIFAVYTVFLIGNFWLDLLLRTALLCVFAAVIVKAEHFHLPHRR